jgi:hypothetical protein
MTHADGCGAAVPASPPLPPAHNTHTHTHTHTRRYYNDLWELDVGEMVWTPVGDMAAGPWPPARSGCQLMLGGAAAGGDAATVYMYGGYVKVRLCV